MSEVPVKGDERGKLSQYRMLIIAQRVWNTASGLQLQLHVFKHPIFSGLHGNYLLQMMAIHDLDDAMATSTL